ncbi:hypothetical protein LTR28_000392 [Elasticomyces elasticus]|nr:hypothetical protein LTR28_000392 [Elasticomyces elasticus]
MDGLATGDEDGDGDEGPEGGETELKPKFLLARHPIETMQHTNVIRRSTSFQIQCLSCSRMAAREAAEKTIVTPVLFSAVGGSIRDEK